MQGIYFICFLREHICTGGIPLCRKRKLTHNLLNQGGSLFMSFVPLACRKRWLIKCHHVMYLEFFKLFESLNFNFLHMYQRCLIIAIFQNYISNYIIILTSWKPLKNSTFTDILRQEKKHELCRPTIMKHYLKHNDPKYKYLQLEIIVYKQCHFRCFVNSLLNLLTV